MKEMVTEFEKQLEKTNKPSFKFYSKIKDVLVQGYGYSKVDIESIFSVIQGIANDFRPEKIYADQLFLR